MKFAYIDQYKGCLSFERLCAFFGVTSRGLRAWKARGVSQHQRTDLVTLAHIKEHHRLCLGTYTDGFYNPRRRHSANGGKSPLAFERKAA